MRTLVPRGTRTTMTRADDLRRVPFLEARRLLVFLKRPDLVRATFRGMAVLSVMGPSYGQDGIMQAYTVVTHKLTRELIELKNQQILRALLMTHVCPMWA